MSKAIVPLESTPDKFGNPITRGSYLVYGYSTDNSPALQIVKVVDVYSEFDFTMHGGVRLTVQGVTESGVGGKSLKRLRSYLKYPGEAIVIPESMLSNEYQNLLRSV